MTSVAPAPDQQKPAEQAQTGPPPGYTQQQPPPGYAQPQMPPPGYGSVVPGYGLMVQPPPPEVLMERPTNIPTNCPPGLEYLTTLDQLLVKQKVELFEMMTGFETKNKYVVKNSLGQKVFKAKEDSDGCMRHCCGNQRAFTMRIEDNFDNEVIQIIRPYKCMFYGQCFSCSSCCQDEVEVQAPIGATVGFVKQLYEGCAIRYAIQDHDRNTVLRIHGPGYCHCYCPGDDIPFELMSADGSVSVGKISKQWGNAFREIFTDADNFGIQFPVDLDVRIKAVILGAVFLIDFMFFERSGRNRRR